MTAKTSPTGIRWIVLDEEPEILPPPHGLVYSNQPRRAGATDGNAYVMKGPDQATVFAEHVAYRLADLVDLATPDHALWRDAGHGVHFASEWLRRVDGYEYLLGTDAVANPELLADVMAFDMWIANGDRNIGNLIGVAVGKKQVPTVRLVAIDFEKAHALRGIDQFSLTAMRQNEFLPRALLRKHCPQSVIRNGVCERIQNVTRADIDRILNEYATVVAPQPQAERVAATLTSRAKMLEANLKEALDG